VKDIRWGWVVLGGFLAELGIFLIAIPLSPLLGPASLLYSGALGGLVVHRRASGAATVAGDA
jgi:hypothetical protein